MEGQSEAAKAASHMTAQDTRNGMSAYADQARGRRAEGRHDRAAVGLRNPAMTWTCTDKMQDKAANAAKRRNAHEVEEEQHRAARAAAGMSAHDNHAQKLYVESKCGVAAAMRSQEPLRYPPLRKQPGVPAQAQNWATQ